MGQLAQNFSHFRHLDLGVLGVIILPIAVSYSIEMHFRESVSIISHW